MKATSRRFVLRGAAALASAGLLPGGSQASADVAWDREVDVVVVGSGSGLVGALVAAQAGLDVLVLEKHSGPGGTTLVSGGVIWIPDNDVQRREGISDDRDAAREYLLHLSMGQADEELIDAFLDHGPAMLDFVERHSAIRWRVSKRLGLVGDYHPEWRGSNVRGRSVEPERPGVDRAGGLLISHLLDAVKALGGELQTSTPARGLVVQQTQDGTRVTGVLAEHGGSTLRVAARRGVLLASGGFERNAVMKHHFLRGPSPFTLGCETNTGDGIRMGMEIGADLRNMNEVWGTSVYRIDAERNTHVRGGTNLMHPGGMAGSMLVNRHGERFCNEGADYDTRWRTFHTWENWGEVGFRNIPAFHVCDHVARDTTPLFGSTPGQPLPDWVSRAPTLRELAVSLGINPAGLAAAVRRFNTFAERGEDPDFHRGGGHYDRMGRSGTSGTLRPLAMSGPYFGAEVAPADLGTCGGLRVDGRARVVNVRDRPIGGLYACGNCSGVGGPGASYGGGGGTLGPALTFAYIAGVDLTRATGKASRTTPESGGATR